MKAEIKDRQKTIKGKNLVSWLAGRQVGKKGKRWIERVNMMKREDRKEHEYRYNRELL